MAKVPVKIKMPRISAGTLRSFIFILLIGLAIAFWLYTQRIIDHVREFQKAIITTQKDIYVDIIDPFSIDSSGVNTKLFEKVFLDSPVPNIISDKNNNPIPGHWRNVGIDSDDDSETSLRKLKNIIEKMDRINPPDSMLILSLIPRTDTLAVYELSPSRNLPVVVTDKIGKILYSRNIDVSFVDSLEIMTVIRQLGSVSKHFDKNNEPSLVYYGISGQREWPIIVTKLNGEPLYWNDVGIATGDTTSSGMARLKSQMRLMKRRSVVYDIVTHHVSGYNTQLFHFGDPRFITWIVWLPVIEFLVILILIVAGYIGFINITKAEQRSIWVGMAKETAHQLGTPISSIDGWVELLKTEHDASLNEKAVKEMEYDVKRLAKVAARFSSIGSRPELQPIKVSDVIDEVLDYFRTRVPRMGRSVILESHIENLSDVLGNRELLNWTFENLVKNALTAIEIKDGRIVVTGMMSKNFKQVILDFEDNGKGITFADQKKIMKPGYTTKNRGWGLGLSLVKRIIEDYHGGKVMLLESKPGVGSTFRVIIPAVEIKGNV